MASTEKTRFGVRVWQQCRKSAAGARPQRRGGLQISRGSAVGSTLGSCPRCRRFESGPRNQIFGGVVECRKLPFAQTAVASGHIRFAQNRRRSMSEVRPFGVWNSELSVLRATMRSMCQRSMTPTPEPGRRLSRSLGSSSHTRPDGGKGRNENPKDGDEGLPVLHETASGCDNGSG